MSTDPVAVRRTKTFDLWFARLRDARAKARIAVRIDRLQRGNPGEYRSLGDGVIELKVDYGPGYRVYYTRELQHSFCCFVAGTSRRRALISNAQELYLACLMRKKKMPMTQPYDVADYLTDDETISYYLIEAFDENDVRAFAKALSHVVRAVGGVQAMAQRTGLEADRLAAASSDEGNPDLSTILKILTVFKVKVSASRDEGAQDPILSAAACRRERSRTPNL